MKIIRQTSNRLTMQFDPLFKEGMFLVFILCIVVCLFVIILSTWDIFTCQRDLSFPTQGQCTLTHQGWITKSQRIWQLEQIKGVDIKTEGFQQNGLPRYWVSLNTTEGLFPLPTDPDSPPFIAEKIQQFLENTQQSGFTEQWDSRPYSFFCLKVCLAFAILFGVRGERVTLEISRQSQRLTICRYSLLGLRRVQYPLHHIVDVIVQKKRGGKLGPMGRSVLVMQDGKQFVIHAYDLFYPEAFAYESTALIRRFIGR